jgi:hypothetical protein
MPATRSRTSTEQAAEVASEEVKQHQEETEPVVSEPVVDQSEVKEAAPVVEEAAPVAEDLAVAEPAEAVAAVETNGTTPVVDDVAAENGTAAVVESTDAEAVSTEEVPVVDKRKSEVIGGEGDGPDSTEVVAKKAKIDEEEVAEAPVEASA